MKSDIYVVELAAVRDALKAALGDPSTPNYSKAALARELVRTLTMLEEASPPPREDDIVTRFRRGDYLDPVDTLAAQRQDRLRRARETANGDAS